jgi:hypothetical protein
MVCLGNDSGNGFIELSKDKIDETIMNEKINKYVYIIKYNKRNVYGS